MIRVRKLNHQTDDYTHHCSECFGPATLALDLGREGIFFCEKHADEATRELISAGALKYEDGDDICPACGN